MKRTVKGNMAGFSLVEVLVAIAIMGIITVPVCGSLILAGQLNARSQTVLTAKLEVQTVVESLMESGVSEGTDYDAKYPNVTITAVPAADSSGPLPCYKVTVSDDGGLVTVETFIRAASAPPAPAPEGGGGS